MLYRLVIVVLIMAGLILSEFEIVMGAEFKLGARFQDADGDMVADTPSDPAKQVDPSTLIFAYTPVEDPAVYAKVWKGFLEHMEKVTGKKVQFFPVQSNAAQIEAMRAEMEIITTRVGNRKSPGPQRQRSWLLPGDVAFLASVTLLAEDFS